MPKLTALAADKLTVKSGRKDFFDPTYPGLALRVSATGRKAWVYFYRIKNGKVHQRRMTLGTYPAMDVAAAHDAWRKVFDLVQAGRDPAIADTTLPPMGLRGCRRGMAQARSGWQQDRQDDRAQVPQLRSASMEGPPHH